MFIIISWMQAKMIVLISKVNRALLMKRRALLVEYKTLLMQCKALLMEYKGLFLEYIALWMRKKAHYQEQCNPSKEPCNPSKDDYLNPTMGAALLRCGNTRENSSRTALEPQIRWSLIMCAHQSLEERWGAGVETQKNVRGEIRGWGRVPFNETYAPSLSTIYDGA